MNEQPAAHPVSSHDNGLPYGSDPARPRWPLYLFGILYGVWLAFLLWLSFFHRGLR